MSIRERLEMDQGSPQQIATAALWRHVWRTTRLQYRVEGMTDAARVLLRTSGATLRHPAMARLLSLPTYAEHVLADEQSDPFMPISHRQFLCNGLDRGQRLECAIHHFRFEAQRYGTDYHRAVYGGSGIPLWEVTAGDSRYVIALHSPRDLRHEGPVSLVLTRNDVWVHETSFAWVDAAIFADAGLAGTVPFITRNQCARFDAPALTAFREAFRHSSPQYFCLAALQAVAVINRLAHCVGIKHRSQIAFDAQYAKSFHSSYCEFWSNMGGTELPLHGHLMPVPPAIAPISDVKAKHRARARQRRMQWDEITDSAIAALMPHQLAPDPEAVRRLRAQPSTPEPQT